MNVYGYIRVSTTEQDTSKNRHAILDFVNNRKLGNVEFIEEHITGKLHFKDRKLGKLLTKMQSGDILIVPELSRIARSVSQIFEVINYTSKNGIILYSLKENFSNNDKTITSTITSTVFALVAQIERDLISIRTKEALNAKKLSGAKLGRPRGKGKSKLDIHKDRILQLIRLKVPKTIIAEQFNTSVPNLYNYLKHIEVK